MAARLLSMALLPFKGLRQVYKCIFVRTLSSAAKDGINSTVDSEELTKFTNQANNWWTNSQFEALLSMNTIRVPFVRDGILSVSGSMKKSSYPLKGYSIIDIGCGGGFLSEPLARLGATVTGLDPGQENIDVAAAHASQDIEIQNNLHYVCDTVENFAATSKKRFDALVCSEVIEHVANVQSFVKACVELTNDGGSLFFTTINRNAISYIVSILGAEYILGIIPLGTHDWNKFIKPQELSETLHSRNCRIVSVEGMIYNPLTKKWSWCGCAANMYALHAVK